MDPVRIGVAGSGFGKTVLMPVFASLPEVRVVALSGSKAASCDLPPGCRPFADWRQMLDEAGMDALAIALPPHIQEEAALYALEKGLHLFCEKPLARETSRARQIEELTAQKGLRGVVDFEFRKLPVFRALVDNRSRLGTIRSVTVDWQVNARQAALPRDSWKHQRGYGGAMASFGCHLVDFCSLLLGKLDVVDYEERTRVPIRHDVDGQPFPVTSEDEFDLRLRSSSGASARIFVSITSESAGGLHVAVEGTEARLLIEDRRPSDYFGGFELVLEKPGDNPTVLLPADQTPQAAGRFDAVKQVAEEFVSAIVHGSLVDSTLGAGAENVRIISDARDVISRRVRS